MLNLVDLTVRKVLDSDWSPSPAKPGFYITAPNESWQAKVLQGMGERLNIYLYEIKESRSFRRSAWDPIEQPNGRSVLSRPPAYVDCLYLISAWSSAADSESTNPVLDEHRVLAEALRVLLRNPEVSPSALGIAGGGPLFQQARLYFTVADPETPRVLNDFWSTMKLPWRPAIQLVVTAPLDLLVDAPPDTLVATLVERYVIWNGSPPPPAGAANFEEWVTIGGWVTRNVDGTVVPGATVTRVATGETVTADERGRFTIAGLRRGAHTLRASWQGLSDEHPVDVPDGLMDQHTFRIR